ncbi:MAG: GxxExxY protein [Deferrisomatales bacterium]|nr:GxxExxY protein [Deferrisomatales bacterium]
MQESEIGTEIVGAAVLVHRELGLGLLETVYEAAMIHEWTQRGMRVHRQVPVPGQGTAWRNQSDLTRGAEAQGKTKNASASQRLCARSFLPLIDPLSFRKGPADSSRPLGDRRFDFRRPEGDRRFVRGPFGNPFLFPFFDDDFFFDEDFFDDEEDDFFGDRRFFFDDDDD